MNYNLLIDSNFENIEKYWELVNCTYSSGVLESNKKIFGIKQRLTLKGVSRVYFRFLYKALTEIQRATIGIQVGETLYVNEEFPRLGKEKFLSIVEEIKDDITIHLIFESEQEKNKVSIRRPLLVDLKTLKYETKYKLDEKLDYRKGLTYYNELKSGNMSDISQWNIISDGIEQVIGNSLVCHVKTKTELELTHNFIDGHLYLLKGTYKPLNDFSSIYIKDKEVINLGALEQVIYMFKANHSNKPKIILENSCEIDGIVALEKIMLIDLTSQRLNLLKDDVERLTYC